jgi:hypothetical protein
MNGTRFIALCGPQLAGGRERAFESVALELKQACQGRLVVVNLDPARRWPAKPAKPSKEGPLRSIREAMASDIPYVDSKDSTPYLAELLKRDGGKSLDGWTLAFLTQDPRVGSLYRVLDSLGIFIPGDSRALPWLFPLLKDLYAEGSVCPVSISIIDEPQIEKAAAFFVSAKKEIESMIGRDIGARFNACISFDPEKVAACASTGLSYTELFPQQETHGQAKAISRELLSSDPGETGRGAAETLKFLIGGS